MESHELLHLLRCRLWIARFGESDVLRWWRTDGILGLNDGAFVGPRVLPKTHPTGRSRIAFAVAKAACDERYPKREARHLFSLDPKIEDSLDALLVEKLADEDFWLPMMKNLENVTPKADLREALTKSEVVSDQDLQSVEDLPMGPDSRSLPLPVGDRVVERLTAAFVRSTPGGLAVPYIDASD